MRTPPPDHNYAGITAGVEADATWADDDAAIKHLIKHDHLWGGTRQAAAQGSARGLTSLYRHTVTTAGLMRQQLISIQLTFAANWRF